jgi:hypothetical protein
VRQLLSDVQRVLTVLFGYTSGFVKQIEDRLSCFVELIVPLSGGANGITDFSVWLMCDTPKSSESSGDLSDKTRKG